MEDHVHAATRALVERARGQAFGPGEDGGQRVIELVRDARYGLAERGHLLGLEQLLIQVARLVVELLALADVAYQRVDAHGVVGTVGLGVRRDLEPDRRPVGAPHAEQVVGDDAVAHQTLEEAVAGLRVVESRRVKRPDIRLGRFRGVSQHQFEVGVGGQRGGTGAADQAAVDALVDRLEEARERLGAKSGLVAGERGGVGRHVGPNYTAEDPTARPLPCVARRFVVPIYRFGRVLTMGKAGATL